MSSRKRRYFKNAAIAVLLLLVAAWVVPSFFNAARYRPLLRAALERSLHRKVTFGHISLHFFPHLGFTVDNVVIDEAPAFGVEPFVSVDQVDCDLRWRSLWHSHLNFETLQLQHPSINIVRNSAGEWNIENLLLQSGISQRSSDHASSKRPPSNLAIDVQNARLNFKVGQNKKPFAIVDTQAHLDFDYGSDRVSFRIAGDPVRTDLELPTPGLVELDGDWAPARAHGHTLRATLRTQGAMLYDWVPLLTGKNPGVYGVMNATIHLSGSLRQIGFLGQARVTQLHRWEQLPASNSMPCHLRFRGQFDRNNERLLISGLDLAFANSQVHVEGAVTSVSSKPDLDLVVAFERSHLQDLLRLGIRVMGRPVDWRVAGRLDGMIAIRGRWGAQLYGGFLNARKVRLDTASGTFPVSHVDIRITRYGIRLSPARVWLAPGVEVSAEGMMRHISSYPGKLQRVFHPTYDLTLDSRSVNLEKLLRFGRALGIVGFRHLGVDGVGSFAFHVVGVAWPWSTPSVTAEAEIHSTRLMIPGLSEPLNIRRARVHIYGKQVVVDPLLAVMGTSVFSGWIRHQRGLHEPWNFDLKADKLNLYQDAQWFEGIGDQASTSFFARLANLGALISGQRPTFNLPNHLDVRGHLSTQLVTYRALALRDFQTSVDIHDRKVLFSKVRFKADDGLGEGNALVDLARDPAMIAVRARIGGADVQAIGPYLPAALSKVRGRYFAAGTFKARGLTHGEILRTLRGKATVRFEDVNLGEFNPIRILARRSGLQVLDDGPQPLLLRAATAHLEVQHRRVILEDFPVELSGAHFELQGDCTFAGAANLRVRADLRGLPEPWVPIRSRTTKSASRLADLHFAGTLHDLEMVPSNQISQTHP